MKYLRTVMRRSKPWKPLSLHIKISPRWSSVSEDCDADDEGFMFSGEFLPSRPLSLSIPGTGPYCPRRPTLQEVLSNIAPPPWTLSAFTQYLSQNHCLETLEFTMDTNRYTKYYHEMSERDAWNPLSPHSLEAVYVRMLWQKLLDAYIAPNGPREVNLPSAVRDRLLSLPCVAASPDPIELGPAVRIVYELMDESVLVPFLNAVAPLRGSPWMSNKSMSETTTTGSLDKRSLSPAKSRSQRDSSPSGSDLDTISQSYSGPSPRHLHSSYLTAALGRGFVSRLSAHSSAEGTKSITDSSTDSPSPSGSALEPMTPPNTPPTSHVGFGDVSPGTSPNSGRVAGSSWKKMGAKLGWKKSRSGHGSGSSNARYPINKNVSDDSAGNGL